MKYKKMYIIILGIIVVAFWVVSYIVNGNIRNYYFKKQNSRSTVEEAMVYKLKKGEKVTVKDLEIENRGVQSVRIPDNATEQHKVTLFMKPLHGQGQEFTKIFIAVEEGKNNPQPWTIQAFGHTITITNANGFISQDIEIKVF